MGIPCKNCPNGTSKTYAGKEPSPNGLGYSAKFEILGRVMKGRDGRQWQIMSKKGVHTWTPIKVYHDFMTLDNGMFPFVVRVSDKSVAYIYHAEFVDEEYDFQEKRWDASEGLRAIILKPHEKTQYQGEQFVLHSPIVLDRFLDILVPEDQSSVLFRMKAKEYVYVGEEVTKFSTKDEIREYHSVVGNNAVPYPFAVGDSNTYFMTEWRTMQNQNLLNRRTTSRSSIKSKSDRLGLGTFDGEGWACGWSPYDELYKDIKAAGKVHDRVNIAPRRV